MGKREVLSEQAAASIVSKCPGEERTLLLLCRATFKFCQNGNIEWQRVRQAVPEIGTVAQCRALWRALAYDKPIGDTLKGAGGDVPGSTTGSVKANSKSSLPSDGDGESDAENDCRPPISGPHDYVADVAGYVRSDMSKGLEETPSSTYESGAARKGEAAGGAPVKRPVEGLYQVGGTPSSLGKAGSGGGGGGSNSDGKKKRRMWAQNEDDTLIKAVEELGIGQWGLMVKRHPAIFADRSATQLSQRWAMLKKTHPQQTAAAAAVGASRMRHSQHTISPLLPSPALAKLSPSALSPPGSSSSAGPLGRGGPGPKLGAATGMKAPVQRKLLGIPVGGTASSPPKPAGSHAAKPGSAAPGKS